MSANTFPIKSSSTKRNIGNRLKISNTGKKATAKTSRSGLGASSWTWDTTPVSYCRSTRKIRSGHAWIQFIQDGKCFLVEPLWRRLGLTLPRLSTMRYRPRFSVAWDGEKLSYYQHHEHSARPPVVDLIGLLPEYVFIWGRFWLGSPLRIPKFLWSLLRRFLKGFRWMGTPR